MKVKGPLFSNLASGSIGPRLTFSQRSSGQQARFQKAQVDVITPARTTQRGYFDEAVGKWNSLSDAEQQQWNDFVTGK